MVSWLIIYVSLLSADLCMCFTSALLLFRLGDFQEAYLNVCKALEVYPNHDDSKELKDSLAKLFASS